MSVVRLKVVFFLESVRVFIVLLLSMMATLAWSATPLQLLQELNEFPHSRVVSIDEEDVLDYEIGLGAMQKISGTWQFKHSERLSGRLTSYTWQIIDGFTSQEVMADLVDRAEQLDDSTLLFSCDGRACGRGVEWANRVFHQPVLYGREDLQRYRVFSIGKDQRNVLIIYASARTADRQYLHAEVFEVTP